MEITELDPIDQAALELAIAHTLAEPDRDRVEQVTSMLADRPRLEVAQFCSYHRQMATLRLRPWETPPCHIDECRIGEILSAPRQHDVHSERTAAKLLEKMLVLGISQYHPDPITAIAVPDGRRSTAV